MTQPQHIDRPMRPRILTTLRNPRSTCGLIVDHSCSTSSLLHYKQPDDPELVAREADELARAAVATSSITGIQPLQLAGTDPTSSVLLTTFVDGAESLFNYVWNGTALTLRKRLTKVTLEDVASRIGRWLRAYHALAATAKVSAGATVRRLTSDTLRKLAAIECRSGYLSLRVSSAVRSFLQHILHAEDEWAGGRLSQIHGDFALSNILVDPNGSLHVADFADTRTGFSCEDVVRVWHELSMIAALSRRRMSFLRGPLATLLQEYGLRPTDMDTSLLLLMRCWNAVCNILTTVHLRWRIGVRSWSVGRRLARMNVAWLESFDWRGAC